MLDIFQLVGHPGHIVVQGNPFHHDGHKAMVGSTDLATLTIENTFSLKIEGGLVQSPRYSIKTFLKKWGITTKFFKKYYLKSKTKYKGPLTKPKLSLNYIFGLMTCKIKFFFTI